MKSNFSFFQRDISSEANNFNENAIGSEINKLAASQNLLVMLSKSMIEDTIKVLESNQRPNRTPNDLNFGIIEKWKNLVNFKGFG